MRNVVVYVEIDLVTRSLLICRLAGTKCRYHLQRTLRRWDADLWYGMVYLAPGWPEPLRLPKGHPV